MSGERNCRLCHDTGKSQDGERCRACGECWDCGAEVEPGKLRCADCIDWLADLDAIIDAERSKVA